MTALTCVMCATRWAPGLRRDDRGTALARWYYRGDDRRVCWFCLRRAARRFDQPVRGERS